MSAILVHNSELPLPADVIPHGPKFRYISGVLSATEGVSAFGYLNITDEHCADHFDGNPVFPGVLQAEALGQLGAYFAMLGNPGEQGVMLTSVQAEYLSPAFPGDVLTLDVILAERRGNIFAGLGVARIEATSEATCVAMVSGLIAKSRVIDRIITGERQKRSLPTTG